VQAICLKENHESQNLNEITKMIEKDRIRKQNQQEIQNKGTFQLKLIKILKKINKFLVFCFEFDLQSFL
jgi:hypothetical protein